MQRKQESLHRTSAIFVDSSWKLMMRTPQPCAIGPMSLRTHATSSLRSASDGSVPVISVT